MKRPLVLLLLGLVGALGVPAVAQASWVSQNCFDDNYPDSIFKRSDARAYSAIARGEGYEYAGGCWNNNDKDDTPGQPDSGGEGPDCSGLVFKSWELSDKWQADGGNWWNKLQNIHGPYSSTTFHNSTGTGFPFHVLPHKWRSTTLYMDAFAREGHIGLIWSNTGTSVDTDTIMEAKGDVYGTDTFEETYRYDDAYVAVRRDGWTADCYPQCVVRETRVVVVP
jgi:hypothetical protein